MPKTKNDVRNSLWPYVPHGTKRINSVNRFISSINKSVRIKNISIVQSESINFTNNNTRKYLFQPLVAAQRLGVTHHIHYAIWRFVSGYCVSL